MLDFSEVPLTMPTWFRYVALLIKQVSQQYLETSLSISWPMLPTKMLRLPQHKLMQTNTRT